MARVLSEALNKDECTRQEIRIILENEPNMRKEINCVTDGYSPLALALKTGKSVDIVKDILDFGADVNQLVFVGYTPINMVYDDIIHFKYGLDRLKLLLEYGANLGRIPSLLLRAHSRILAEDESCFPLFKLMLQYAERSAKYCALQHLCDSAIGYSCRERYEKEWVLTNTIKMVELFLDSGAKPDIHMVNGLLERTTDSGIQSSSSINLFFVMDVFELLLERVFINDFCQGKELLCYDWSNEGCKSYIDRRNLLKRRDGIFWDGSKLHIAKILFHLLKELWNKYLEQCLRMCQDMLTNNNSVMQTLQDLRGDTFETTEDTVPVLREMLIKAAKIKYPLFTNSMKQVFQTMDLTRMYPMLSKPLSDNRLNFDCFCILCRYLSKEDSFNFLVALICKEN